MPKLTLTFHRFNRSTVLDKKLEMCPEDTDAPASEMLEVGNLLYTAQ